MGVLWLLARLLLIMLPPGLSAVAALERGVQLPSRAVIALIVLAAPETMIGPSVPPLYVFVCFSLGVGAIAWSYQRFNTTDLGGKRSQ